MDLENREHNSSSSKGTSLTNTLLFLASLGAGAYQGYCHTKNIPIDNGHLELALTYGPAVVRGAFGALGGGLGGSIIGGVLGADSLYHRTRNVLFGLGAGFVGGVSIGAGIGAAKGAIQKWIGYGLGCLAAYITK